MTHPLSVAHLTALHASPPELIHAAAAAGFDAVGLRLLRVTPESPGYPLMDDLAALKETLAALDATEIAVSDIEFVRVTPELDPASIVPLLDVGVQLGVRHLITAPYDDDLGRLADKLAALSALAHQRSMSVVLEFFPWTCVRDLASCLDIVTQAGPEIGILVDALHFNRSDSSLDLLASIPSNRLPFVHLCDAPVQAHYTEEELLYAARQERLAPGDGEIDLSAFLRALPADVPIGVEIPSREVFAANRLTDRLCMLRTKTLDLIARQNASGRCYL